MLERDAEGAVLDREESPRSNRRTPHGGAPAKCTDAKAAGDTS